MEQGLGNDDPNYAPHGVYPTLGENGWVAITCLTEEHWLALSAIMGRDDLVKNQSFATLSHRLLNRRALDQIIASLTTSLRADDVEILLQGRGIPAAAVKDSKGVCLDEQLARHGYLIDIDHPVVGRTVVEGSRFILSRTPAMTPRPAPTIGGDNQQILEEILGYDEGRISEFAETGALH